jgi:DNA-directed RNA polymerase subunit RPC12/RpoP
MDGTLQSVTPRRAYAFGLVAAIALTLVVGSHAMATTPPREPAQAMTVTVRLDRASYLRGDDATATAIVYRTPTPANYTYTWRVRDPALRLLNTTPNATPTFVYPIPLDYPGAGITFEAMVDDGQGLAATGSSGAAVHLALMALQLDRGDFVPGDTIVASYSVLSHVITRPTYDYEVDDSGSTIVASGNTNATSFSFRTPVPSSASYAFLVTAREGANRTEAQVQISQASGVVLGVSLDKVAYAPGETIRAHLTLTPRGTTPLPRQFAWILTLGTLFGGSPAARAITTSPEVDLALPIPAGSGTGDLLVFAFESSTGATQYGTVHVGPTNALWTTEIAGIPLWSIMLSLLFLLTFIAVVGLWRRVAAAAPFPMTPLSSGAPAPLLPMPMSPEAPPQPPPPAPMSIPCAACGQPIELTTNKRPIDVMCPSCGGTQLVP